MTIEDYIELLAVEGYRPKCSEAQTVVEFKHDGEIFTLENAAEDATYVRLRSVFRLPEDADQLKAFRAANDNNERLKGVKTVVDVPDSVVVFSIEAFYSNVPHFAPHLGRALKALDGGSDSFFKALASDAQ